MRQILFFTLLSLALTGCGEKTGKKFFIYDEIIHYSIDFHGSKLQALSENQHLSVIDSLKLSVISGYIPKDNQDLNFIDKLEEIGYTKKTVDKSEFEAIDNIFSEKKVKEGITTACIPIFRDILLFKMQNKVIGTAKICFECMQHHITGTIANTNDFGQDGDYERLLRILYK